jgi:hypothetical protein
MIQGDSALLFDVVLWLLVALLSGLNCKSVSVGFITFLILLIYRRENRN